MPLLAAAAATAGLSFTAHPTMLSPQELLVEREQLVQALGGGAAARRETGEYDGVRCAPAHGSSPNNKPRACASTPGCRRDSQEMGRRESLDIGGVRRESLGLLDRIGSLGRSGSMGMF